MRSASTVQKRSSKFSALSPKPVKSAMASGHLEDAGELPRHLEQQRHDARGIGAVGDADRDGDAAAAGRTGSS